MIACGMFMCVYVCFVSVCSLVKPADLTWLDTKNEFEFVFSVF